jgi:hypothetical protein
MFFSIILNDGSIITVANGASFEVDGGGTLFIRDGNGIAIDCFAAGHWKRCMPTAPPIQPPPPEPA